MKKDKNIILELRKKLSEINNQPSEQGIKDSKQRRKDVLTLKLSKEVTKKWFSENFNSDRFQQIKNLALIVDARKKVSKEDLIKLGLYNGT